MRRCTECRVDVEGDWSRCPLCSASLAGEESPGPIPAVPLRFSRRRVFKALTITSILVILASFAAQLLFDREAAGIGALRSVWLGVCAMWLLAIMMVRKRSNVAKSTVYFVVLGGLVAVYWDYLTGWGAWSLTYAVPMLCISSIAALLITVAVMRIDAGDHIVYSGLTVLLGLTPVLFLGLGWVTSPLPSLICGALSFFTLVSLQQTTGREARHELRKRLHL
ncbi:hypothetical protein SAMN02745244_02557 [Tessaracoccus bendigoensis DSM 12906]|uniref:Zinc ribbon domain-containing protein n=1 Tax=Tessaracoccus bendigoensis DSM 12906 TaxID=1123357 RepID=A0A1M6JH18_9ACTN|nr:DUF6320 domain-containing protein [Tessaracoccus bendigoensis]SHJ45912.1 hypothetical protein SAMN02745244_02557 [Tessaracoccus bendigoensis DSM 12906]